MDDAIKRILDGVDFIPRCGNPGTLVVFEQNAYPILSCGDVNSIIFAGAEVGHGRIFVTTHESYIENFIKSPKDFGKLWSNIKKWLLKGENINDDEILNVENFQTISQIPSNCKMLKWIGTHYKLEKFQKQLFEDYLSKGGSIICGICPWGY